MRSRVVGASSVSVARPAADHLAERPERDALAVRGERPWCQQTDSTTPSMYLWNSQASRLLPMPGWPDHRHEPRATLAGGRVEAAP